MDTTPECPINAAVEVFGDRWCLLILRDVIFEDRRNFRALLLGSPEGIASNILADRLVRLVEAGVLVRGQGRRGQRAFYSLTEAGIQAVPTLNLMARWSQTWRGGASACRHATSSCSHDSAQESELMADLRLRHLTAE
ncbi:winged helix-turn-helix transcriptional regulator [Nocardioides cynanchi]|uniref:winged helix-turn-helix transcriptional regulator n=1 Tax=Nocardioides cynanchi TaxID=2558918 RepID=UPI001247B228|nr:helix-turn-helix domain-containing protein [Nocardioides cynanchi]